ncbi:Protein CLEC-49, partial [Aphelenchoides avenae]
ANIHASAFTCKGCAAIRGSNCFPPTTTTSTVTTTTLSQTTTGAPQTTLPGANCDDAESIVQIDVANNTKLTSGLNAAWNGWSRPDKANFAAYKKRIENAVYEPVWSGSEKISAVAKILDGYAPDGSAAKDIILAVPIGGWGTFCDFLNCAIRRGFMEGTVKDCAKYTPTTTTTTTTATTSAEATRNLCDDDTWTYFSTTNACYKVLTEPQQEAGGAALECEAMGAHLTSIHSFEEQLLVLSLVPQDKHPLVIIGLRSDEQRKWFWEDGSPFDYTTWAPVKPDNINGLQCAFINFDYKWGSWDDLECQRKVVGVCKKPSKPGFCTLESA